MCRYKRYVAMLLCEHTKYVATLTYMNQRYMAVICVRGCAVVCMLKNGDVWVRDWQGWSNLYKQMVPYMVVLTYRVQKVCDCVIVATGGMWL